MNSTLHKIVNQSQNIVSVKKRDANSTQNLFGPFPDLYYVLLRVGSKTVRAMKEEPDLVPELCVSDTVDEWTEQTWKNIGEQEGNKQDGIVVFRPCAEQQSANDRRNVGQRRDEELHTVQQDGVTSISGRSLVRTRCCPGCKDHLHVGGHQSEEDENPEKNLWDMRTHMDKMDTCQAQY